MPTFIKTEQFTKKTLTLMPAQRSKYIKEHLIWASQLKDAGNNIASGYLVDERGNAGGGGFLVIEANNFEEAKLLIMEDPMIKNNLVTWEIQEWIIVEGDFSAAISEEMIS